MPEVGNTADRANPLGTHPGLRKLTREDSQISFNQGEYLGDLVRRQYCLLPAPKIYQKYYYRPYVGTSR